MDHSCGRSPKIEVLLECCYFTHKWINIFVELDYKQTGCKDAPLQCKTKGAVCMAEACDCDTLFYYDNGECLPSMYMYLLVGQDNE